MEVKVGSIMTTPSYKKKGNAKMKRNSFISFVLIFSMLISLFTFTISTSAATGELTVSDVTAKAGSTAKITIDLDNNPGFIAMKLGVEYNDRYFSVKSVTDGEILGSSMHSNRYEDSPYTLYWYNALEDEDITEDGEIAEIIFDVASNTPNGTYNIKLLVDNGDVVNADLDEIGDDFDIINGKITVTGGSSSSSKDDDDEDDDSIDPVLKVSNASVVRGDTFDVKITLDNNPGLIALRTMLDFDDDYFTVEKVVDGGILGDKYFSNVYDKSPYTLYWTNPLAKEDIEKDGTIATVTFSSNKKTPAGKYTIGLKSEDGDILNYELESIGGDFEFDSGVVTVTTSASSTEPDEDEDEEDKDGDYKLSFVAGKAQIVITASSVSYGQGRLVSLDADVLKNALDAAKSKYSGRKIAVKVVYSGDASDNLIVSLPEGYAYLMRSVESFAFETDRANMMFDSAAIAEMAIIDDSVQFIFGKEIPEDKLEDLISSEYEYYDVSSTVKFDDGNVTVSLPYKAANDILGKHAVVYSYDGKKLVSVGSAATYEDGVITFNTSKITPYLVTIEEVGFEDIKNHWGKDAINFVAARGIFNGVSETKFDPDSQISRGMLVTVLGRLDQIDVAGYNCMFADVDKNMYYAPYIEWARRNNIVGGTGDNKFEPDRSVNRQEIAVIVSRYLEYKGKKLDSAAVQYSDVSSIDSWAKEFVYKVNNAGIITGVGTEFQPKEKATRAQAATILKRIAEFLD